jgi:hypothetical protein
MLGPHKDGELCWIKHNRELYELFQEPGKIVIMKAGHVNKMGASEMPERIITQEEN